jgi:hypothetical protein
MSGLSDVLNSGWVPEVFEQVVRLRLFGISAFFSRHTGFRVFVGSHGFSCFCQFTRLPVSHGFPCFRVFGVTGDSVLHGFPCLRVFALPRSSNCMFVVWSFGQPVHALLFALCVTSTLLVGIGPSHPPCCRGAVAYSASFPSSWASVDSASLNHTFVHRRSPNDFLFPSRRRHPIDFRSRRFRSRLLPPIQALSHLALPLSSALRRGLPGPPQVRHVEVA